MMGRLSRAVTEFWILLRIQLATFRLMGPFALMISGVLPLGMLFVLRSFAGPLPPERAITVVAGSLVMGTANTCIATMGQLVSELRLSGAIAYYATLPVARWRFITAIATAYLLAGIPSLLIILFASPLILGQSFSLHWGLPLVFVAGALALAGLGAVIGLYSRSPMAANVYSLAVSFGMMFLAPVYYTLDALPAGLRLLSWAWPVTYYARALRGILSGSLQTLATDVAILAGFALVLMWLVQYRVTWRER